LNIKENVFKHKRESVRTHTHTRIYIYIYKRCNNLIKTYDGNYRNILFNDQPTLVSHSTFHTTDWITK
jgi:hypothetical protein